MVNLLAVPWGFFAVLGLVGLLLGFAIDHLRRAVGTARPLRPLSPATYQTFGGVASEAPRGFRGFAWKFSLTFVLFALAVLLLNGFVTTAFDAVVRAVGTLAAWPYPAPPLLGPDYVFLLFLALFATLTAAAGLEFEAVRSSTVERLRPLVFLAIYVFAAATVDVALNAAGVDSVYALLPRAAMGGALYTIALFSSLTRPKPIVVATERRDPGTRAAFVLCFAASIAAGFAVVLVLYPVWLASNNPFLRLAFLLLIPSLAYTFFGAFGLLRYLWVERGERARRPRLADFHPPVSVIIPAYQEAATITETLLRVDRAAAEYPGRVEVIVGNDGSTDRTSEVARTAIGTFHHATGEVVDLAHGGKSSALNGALLRAHGDIVIRIDADTPVASFASIIPYFADPDMGEVQGRILPARQTGWITKLRLLEVMWAHAYYRRAQIATGILQVMSGNFCAFRRDRLLAAGGWVPWNGEDAEISIRLLRMGYKMRLDLDALAFEDTPKTLPSLVRQRIRWNRGGYFSHAYHLGALFGALECGALSLYWWLGLAVRGSRKFLTLVFAAAISLTIVPLDFFRVALLLGLMLLPRMLIIGGMLVRWGYARQIGWVLSWPALWMLRSYFWLEALGTMLPGNTPEFSD